MIFKAVMTNGYRAWVASGIFNKFLKKKQLLPFLAIISVLLGEPIKPLKISEPIDSLS